MTGLGSATCTSRAASGTATRRPARPRWRTSTSSSRRPARRRYPAVGRRQDHPGRPADGLETVVADAARGWRGGERQRIVLAGALLRRPALLVPDEATGQLDVAAEREVAAALRSLRRRTTIVAVTHRTALMAATDRILLLQNGRVAAAGTWPELDRCRRAVRMAADECARPVWPPSSRRNCRSRGSSSVSFGWPSAPVRIAAGGCGVGIGCRPPTPSAPPACNWAPAVGVGRHPQQADGVVVRQDCDPAAATLRHPREFERPRPRRASGSPPGPADVQRLGASFATAPLSPRMKPGGRSAATCSGSGRRVGEDDRLRHSARARERGSGQPVGAGLRRRAHPRRLAPYRRFRRATHQSCLSDLLRRGRTLCRVHPRSRIVADIHALLSKPPPARRRARR